MMATAALWLSLAVRSVAAAVPVVQHLQSIAVPKAAMLSIARGFPGSPSPALLVTTFSTLAKDQVYVVRDLAAACLGRPVQAEVLVSDVQWPNQASLAPPGVLGGRAAVLVAGGFLVPGKSTGKVTLTLLDTREKLQLSHDKDGFFYHEAMWVDFNADGRLDLLTARASRPVLSSARAEMLWLEQPVDPLQAPWPEHILFEGPGHSFIYDDWTQGAVPQPQILSANFFATQDLALYVCEGGTWPTCPQLQKVQIDDALGPYFSVQKVDLNGDGQDDLLATNNRADGRGAVFAYEMPSMGVMGNWTRHVLASGYAPRSSFPYPGRGAPGASVAFHLKRTPPGKPWVLVSGDDSGLVQLLVPASQSPDDWRYEHHTIMKGKGTVGGIAAEDVDGDGRIELFIADFSGGTVEVFTLLEDGTLA